MVSWMNAKQEWTPHSLLISFRPSAYGVSAWLNSGHVYRFRTKLKMCVDNRGERREQVDVSDDEQGNRGAWIQVDSSVGDASSVSTKGSLLLVTRVHDHFAPQSLPAV